jgi:DNA repair protein RadA/Sms
LGFNLQAEDVFVNIAGGIKICEPAIDLGIAAAIASSFRNRVIDPQTVMMGEIGLTGEARSVMQLEARIGEAERLGFARCVVPYSAKRADAVSKNARIRVQFVKTLGEALDAVL